MLCCNFALFSADCYAVRSTFVSALISLLSVAYTLSRILVSPRQSFIRTNTEGGQAYVAHQGISLAGHTADICRIINHLRPRLTICNLQSRSCYSLVKYSAHKALQHDSAQFSVK